MPGSPIRVRFAPSPTGHFHIGGARTALYNFLLARQTGGQFILRIEDTDQKRSQPEFYDELRESLQWLGIAWNEGPDVGGPHAPYNQLARNALYQEHAQRLLDTDHAYRCFCSPARLQELREAQQRRKEPPRYDGLCRALAPDAALQRVRQGEPFVIRFKTPREGQTAVRDHLRGEMTVEHRTIDDYVLVKSDGLALYHLAAMVDDHLMGITHVLRGAEWLGTLPLHALIIRAFGWTEPVWVHLSVFLKPGGKGKMSKRDVSSEQSIFILGLRDLGYLPEAVANWIALMGASFIETTDVYSLDDMVAHFRLDHLTPSPASVNFEKLDHFNGVHIRRLPLDDLSRRLAPVFERAGLSPDAEKLTQVARIVQERIVTLDESVEMAGFFFRPDVSPAAEALIGQGMTAGASAEAVRRAHDILSEMPSFSADHIEPPLRALAGALGLKPGQLFGILRMAITGQKVSPPLFETMEIVGRQTVLGQLATALEILREL